METQTKEIKTIFRNIFRDIKSIIDIREENKKNSKQNSKIQASILSKYYNIQRHLSNINTKINLLHLHIKSKSGGTKIYIKKSYHNILLFYESNIKDYKINLDTIPIFIKNTITLKNDLYTFILGIFVPDLIKRNLLNFGEYSVNEQLSLEPDLVSDLKLSKYSSSTKKTSHK